MPFYGSIVVIRRTGLDGSIFPLVSSECLLGRGEHCDIRVQLPTVSGEHCKITINNSDQVRKPVNMFYGYNVGIVQSSFEKALIFVSPFNFDTQNYSKPLRQQKQQKQQKQIMDLIIASTLI